VEELVNGAPGYHWILGDTGADQRNRMGQDLQIFFQNSPPSMRFGIYVYFGCAMTAMVTSQLQRLIEEI